MTTDEHYITTASRKEAFDERARLAGMRDQLRRELAILDRQIAATDLAVGIDSTPDKVLSAEGRAQALRSLAALEAAR